jgi:VIT1/CCC1 family predicted Fe2+/Mn2+ transporter
LNEVLIVLGFFIAPLIIAVLFQMISNATKGKRSGR